MMLEDLLRAGFALGVVIILVLLLGVALRRFGGFAGTGRLGGRLAVVESLSLDPRRRLVLIRRDGTEHLLLLGPTGDLVVGGGADRPAPPPLVPTPPAAEPTP